MFKDPACHLERNEVESRDLRSFDTYLVKLVRRSLDSLCSLGMTLDLFGVCVTAEKTAAEVVSAADRLFNYSSPKPLGFWLCQRHASRHMSPRVFSAFQPSSSADLPGSA